jgi:hypothetical protein
MDFDERPWEPAVGAFRARFRTSDALAEPERESLLRDLAGDSPRPPNQGHIGADGAGWLLYSDESLTATDRDEIGDWLRKHPRLRAISMEAVTE